MDIACFADLLSAAKAQQEPQRLLFVFVAAELPEDATGAEQQRHADGEGGSLRPVLCVDKLPAEVADFAGLREESERTGLRWDLVFSAGLSGRGGHAPGSDEAEQPLKMMVGAIEAGSIGNFIAFDRSGQAVSFF
ncbi:ribonucleotide reductase subunit alpha [Pseudomonas sp. N040]|uniref:ribonucleotide reductase subunit alpha n=1 Tax=Pseudomonas sp. N040 TaxID=2785325 RepID=UPI0018A290DF|nr:ribonucleotide reductase subunit alpha [Pseudomonas sp. N040]MBF7728635.1 ribonucleotide reductase subunit alpha [Pseudomonas sp. N040]MBW7012275.1 ribonucleotide reductase subunit alpha [Pseudomonas sp. N040]